MMADETTTESTDENSNSDGSPPSVFLVSYPNIVFLYPSVLAALFGAIFMWSIGNNLEAENAVIPARIFLTVLAINLVVVSFDFPRTTSLTWFFAVVAGSVGLWTLFRLNENVNFEELLSNRNYSNVFKLNVKEKRFFFSIIKCLAGPGV